MALGTIQVLRNNWTGWVGSENSHACLLSVHSGSEKVQKSGYVIFEWSLIDHKMREKITCKS